MLVPLRIYVGCLCRKISCNIHLLFQSSKHTFRTLILLGMYKTSSTSRNMNADSLGVDLTLTLKLQHYFWWESTEPHHYGAEPGSLSPALVRVC